MSFVRKSVLSALPLILASVTAASAVELPTRKAGLWEIKMVHEGSSAANMTTQHCTDETTDKKMTSAAQPMADQACAKQDTRKTANGFASDSVCNLAGMTMTSHSETVGDFNSGYTVKITSHYDNPMAGMPKDSAMTIEAKWLGACKADMKPGDIVMPGGIKMNVTDLEKMKALLKK